jgi:hypothetical protein
MEPDFTMIPFDPYPLAPAVPVEPILTGDDVLDAPSLFVADPFLFHEAKTWHLFFEAYVIDGNRGKIGHATSLDGRHWSYDRIVLAMQAHLAYPYVFKADADYYMLMVPSTTHNVELFKAYDFPYDWRYEATLLAGRDFADPSIILRDSVWWIFVGESGTGKCRLYFASQLRGPWLEHPESPIVNDTGKGRPGGRLTSYGGGRLMRLAQRNDQSYGQGVRAFEVDHLTRWSYSEHEIPESPILFASGQGWNSDGMHTCDPWWNGTHWLVAVDGLADRWSIGIYRTAQVADVEAGGPGGSLDMLLGQNQPNPFNTTTRIEFEVPAGSELVPAVLTLYDAGGRLVRVLEAPDAWPGAAGGHYAVSWDGGDARGASVPAGVYFYSLRLDGGTVTRRLLRLP